MFKIIVTTAILAATLVTTQVQACEVQVEQQFAENAVNIRTGKATTGILIVSFDNPVFTGVVEGRNKYIGDLVIEWQNGGNTETIPQIELRGRCKPIK